MTMVYPLVNTILVMLLNIDWVQLAVGAITVTLMAWVLTYRIAHRDPNPRS